ncbi:MAG: helix-hairpin-helix domain-containing protein [Fibrobacter sp.]|nr:helix-hairpin-helix domain-containing protein [Fibrobacter sp.]MBR2899457.1 helix-hairpin-helix domain-containing protein [Fibrobacter sp.]
MALVFLVLGLVFRYLPWGVPAIGQVEEYSNLEYVAERENFTKKSWSKSDEVTDKVTMTDSPEHKTKKQKNAKNKQKKPNLPIHVNSAGVEELCALKGVGPKLAEKILAFRVQNGPFSGPQDLEKVPGIGKKKLEGLLQGVIFD